MAGRGHDSNTQMAETVRALLAERRRATQPRTGSNDVLPDQKSRTSRVAALLEQRRVSAPVSGARRQRSGSPESPKHMYRSREGELLSPDSSMSFEFDQPQDNGSPVRSTARHARSASAAGTSPSRRPSQQRAAQAARTPPRAITEGGVTRGSAQRVVLEALPDVGAQPTLPLTATESLSSRLQSYMAPPSVLARHLSPQQQAAWQEIQHAIETSDTSPTRSQPVHSQPLPQPNQQPTSVTPTRQRATSQPQPTAHAQQHEQHQRQQPSPSYQPPQPTQPTQHSPQQQQVPLPTQGLPVPLPLPVQPSTAQPPPETRPSLAELERKLALAMSSMSLHTMPGGVPGDTGGPFDISELWAGRRDSQASASQSTQSTTATHGRPSAPPRGPLSAYGRAAAAGAPAAGRSRSAPRARPRAAVAAVSEGLPLESMMPGGQPMLMISGDLREFTFKPRINESSRQMVSASYPVDLEDRLEQLSVPKTILLQKYEQVRRDAEAAELKECTFTPRTGRPPSPAKVQRTGPVHERLYAQQPSWQQKRQALLEEREQAALADCTFKPQVSVGAQRRAASAGRLPLHMRVHDVLRSRNESLSNARIRAELSEEGVTFQPSINPRSVQLASKVSAQQGTQGVAAGERLYHEALLARTTPRHVDSQSSEGAECTFAPAINDRSRLLVAHSSELPLSFLQRQEYLAALAAEKRAVFASQVEDAQRKPPQQGQRERDQGMGSSREHSGSWASDDLEAGRDRLAKLAYTDVRRSAALKDALTRHYYGQFSFQPDINPRSRVIGKSHTIDDLYRNDTGRHVRQVAAHEVAVQEVAQCTFAPQLNPTSLQQAQVRRSGSLLDSLGAQQILQERAAKLQEARAMKQYEQMKECTFTPEINKGRHTANKKVDMSSLPGVAAYLDTQQAARRKAEEDRRRQEQVWWQRPQGSRQLFTVPQPFSFEERQRQQQLAEEAAEYQLQQAAAPASRRQQQQAAEAAEYQRHHQAAVAADREEAARISLRRRSRVQQPPGSSSHHHATTVSQVLQQAEALEAAVWAEAGGQHTTRAYTVLT